VLPAVVMAMGGGDGGGPRSFDGPCAVAILQMKDFVPGAQQRAGLGIQGR